MTTTLVTSIKQGDLHPLAYQGLLVYENSYQLLELIRSRLGLSHVLVFAEPMLDAGRQVIDWYCPVQGQIRPFADLLEENKQAIHEYLAVIAADVRNLAETLKANSQRSLGGELLDLAVLYPGDEWIYLVGEQPVITCWGFGPATLGAQPEDLTRLGAGSKAVLASAGVEPAEPAKADALNPTPPLKSLKPADTTKLVEPLQSIAPVASGWSWWWLLPLLLLLLLLLLLFTNVGSLLLAKFMPSAPIGQVQTDDSRHKELRQQLWERAGLCQLDPATNPAPTPLVIPKASDADLQFMEGLWRCDSELEDGSGEPLVVEYRFDTQGHGFISILRDAQQCVAEAQASRQGNELTIDTQDVITCPNGVLLAGQVIVCTQDGAQTKCVGQNKNSQTFRWNANFYKP